MSEPADNDQMMIHLGYVKDPRIKIGGSGNTGANIAEIPPTSDLIAETTFFLD